MVRKFSKLYGACRKAAGCLCFSAQIVPQSEPVVEMRDLTMQWGPKPVLDRVNFDEYAVQSGRLSGVPESMINDDKKVAQIRQARAQQQAADRQIATEQAAAGIVKDAAPAAESGGLDKMMAMGEA